MPRKKQSLTVEGLWSIKRVGTPTISPDGRAACAAVTAYDMNKNDGRTELSTRADDRNPHAAFSILNFCICASSNTPSQRATTAVAMQLPITLTAVWPMSIT